MTWKQRLQKRAQGQDWVKGAVNFDEDLHFSTYYLRASCATVTAPLYPGYSWLVASYEGFNETYYVLKSECEESAAAIVGRALRKPLWLPRILSEIRRRSDALAGIFPVDISPAQLGRLSDDRLLALYCRHDRCHRSLYKCARLPEALDRGVSYFTNYLLGHLRGLGMDASAANKAFDVLSQPVGPSVLAQEILEFDEIADSVRSRPSAIPHSTDGPARARMALDPKLFRQLDAHRDKWQFLSYHGYGRRDVATLGHYLERLMEQVRNPNALADCAGLVAQGEQADRKRRDLLKRLGVDEAHQRLFELYPEIGAAKLYRRYAQVRNFYHLDMLLAEIAQRLGVSEWMVRCMLPEEVMVALKSGRSPSLAIRERQGGCVYVLADGHEHVVGGDQAAELRELFRQQPPSGGAPNVLRGVVACRGKAVGRCKVIIRADDCRAGFEKGTIVVSESTDPDLVRFLRAAGAVLTEQGGVTSHAAIICRELGVPTIIGIDGLLERVCDGDWLEVDAEEGTVKLAQAPVPITVAAAGRGTIGRDPGTIASDLSPHEIGAKAYNLAVVRSLGFRVPDYIVVGYDEVQRVARRPEAGSSRQIVNRLLAELGLTDGDKLAVRSSALAEDRVDGSAAGAYQSLLNVGREGLGLALRAFVSSNGQARDGSVYRGSVIVQRMIEADCSGVCLTRESRTGHGDAVIVELTAGGNAGITGGAVRPDRVVVDRRTGDILHEERGSTGSRPRVIDIAWMVQQFLTLEARFGKPLDIEWAMADRELYFLQARPIVGGNQ